MRKLTLRERTLLALTMTVIFAALLYSIAIEPRILRIQQLHNEIAVQQRELQTLGSLLVHRDEILARAEALEERIETGGDAESEMTAFLREVQALAGDSLLKTLSMRPQGQREGDFYRTLSVQFSAEGSPLDVATFLYKIRQSPQLLRVDGLSCSALREKNRLRLDFVVVKILNPEIAT